MLRKERTEVVDVLLALMELRANSKKPEEFDAAVKLLKRETLKVYKKVIESNYARVSETHHGHLGGTKGEGEMADAVSEAIHSGV